MHLYMSLEPNVVYVCIRDIVSFCVSEKMLHLSKCVSGKNVLYMCQ